MPPYQGVIAPIPIGQDGLNATRNRTLPAPTELVATDNLSYAGGVLEKEGGAAKENSSAVGAPSAIYGGWDWWPTTAAQREILLAGDGKVYRAEGAGTFTAMENGATPTPADAAFTVSSSTVPVFVTGGAETSATARKLFIFGVGATSVDDPAAPGTPTSTGLAMLSGDSTDIIKISGLPTDWDSSNPPLTGCLHAFGGSNAPGARLWGAGNANWPHNLYYSLATDHEHVNVGGQLLVYSGEGDGIKALTSYRGVLIILKYPQGIYYLDTTTWDPELVGVRRLTDQIGIAGPRAFAQVPGDIIFMSAEGTIHSLASVFTTTGDFELSNISALGDMDQWMRDNTNFGSLGRVKAAYYPAKKEVHFAYPRSGSTVNNGKIVLDLNRPQRPRFRTSNRDTTEDIWMRRDGDGVPRPAMGDNVGFMWDLDTAARSKDGAGYCAVAETAETDFGWLDPRLRTVQKNGQFLELIAENVGTNNSIDVSYYWDGMTEGTLNYATGTLGTSLVGTAVVGTDVVGSVTTQLRTKQRITGQGRTFSLKVLQDGPATNFGINSFLLHFTAGDERFSEFN